MAGFRLLLPPLVALTLALAGCATAPGPDVALTDRAQQAIDEGDLKGAEAMLNEALAANPDSLPALTTLAGLHVRQYRYDRARPLCERVVAREADYRQSAAAGEAAERTGRLLELARAHLETIAREEAEDRELLALTPPGTPATPPPAAARPLIREAAPVMVAAPVAAAPLAPPAAKAPRSTRPAASPALFRYGVQVGAFKSRSGAERLSRRLNERHRDVTDNKEVMLTDAGGLTKVQIGPYENMQEASDACRALDRAGIRCFPKAQ